ncbi:MAG: hypothetical protein Tp176DCM1853251_53 [Prokaryotic dsDNA virus sp.]|jgi:hypothetical protein|nr:MAG: hypothetical protein Tp176DCM1853251_53 [Prokaryotic dsDNA virus sp.]|tara:strand:+ start:3019 stop:3468 length:450 start_codon:yes stop_codon:yes gene_type:complete
MASNDTPKTIDLWGVGVQNEAAVTDAVVTPGMLLARTAGGVRPHNVAGGTASPAFAVENEWIGGTISDNYAIGENCYFRTFAQGSAVYAILAASQTISVGDLLQSNGAGALIEASTADNVVARALEAVTTTGATARIRAEIVTGYTSAV